MFRNETPEYKVGSVIQYHDFVGNLRTVKVEGKDADIKNGRAGFDGKCLGCDDHDHLFDNGVWGYDNQIVRVVSL